MAVARHRRLRTAWPGLALAVLAGACGEASRSDTPGAPQRVPTAARSDPTDRPVPASMAGCRECHPREVDEFLAHGMADTLAPLDPPGDPRRPPAGARSLPTDVASATGRLERVRDRLR